MLLCDLQFKQDTIVGKDYQKIINDLEKLVDNTFAQKEIIYFLLLKDLLLEFYLNLLICLNHKVGDFTEISSIYEASDLEEGVALIREQQPDIVFLDIEMPKYSGLQIAELLMTHEMNFQLIFVTAYNEYAVQAFKLSAIDYILKPIDIQEFKLAVEKDCENPFYNNSLAYAFVQAELYDDAIEYYQKAINLNPDKQWTAIVCQALGSIYYQIKGNYEAAIATFQAGIVLDPENSEIYLSLGDVYMVENDLSQVEFAKLLKIDQSRVSEIVNHRIDKVSTDKLIDDFNLNDLLIL